MLNQHSLEEIGDIHNLLEDIKKEYEMHISAHIDFENSYLNTRVVN